MSTYRNDRDTAVKIGIAVLTITLLVLAFLV